jgi:death-on-curing protein
MIHYLTVEEVLLIHEMAVLRYGGSPEATNLGRLEASVAAPMQTMFGEDLYPDLWSKAATLLFSLIENHPFTDGNKRTGLAATLEFLERNGYTLAMSDNDELYSFVMDIATGNLERKAIAAWIRAHSVPVP